MFSEFRFWGGSGNTANYNVPAIINEQNVFKTFERKANTISWYFRTAAAIDRRIEVSTQSATNLHQVPDRSVDYVFTDVPFGSNINYSEMNFLWESWLRTFTDNKQEAIVSRAQNKSYDDYQRLLKNAFIEVKRVLKDNAWLTVVFHNSSEKAWAAIQHAVVGAGFKILGTQTFDKEHGTFKMFVSENAVGYDLVLHCQKTDAESNELLANPSARANALEFIRARLFSSDSFTVQYLHVNRADEFDYRRLYSEWLADALPRELVECDFESFRALVDAVRREKCSG
jgi:adenine-specific DNA methylase